MGRAQASQLIFSAPVRRGVIDRTVRTRLQYPPVTSKPAPPSSEQRVSREQAVGM